VPGPAQTLPRFLPTSPLALTKDHSATGATSEIQENDILGERVSRLGLIIGLEDACWSRYGTNPFAAPRNEPRRSTVNASSVSRRQTGWASLRQCILLHGNRNKPKGGNMSAEWIDIPDLDL
jgi:hypothetical protein